MSRRYNKSTYSAYRGRRGGGARSVLQWVALALAVVLVLAVILLWVLQNSLVYTDRGVTLELPWNQTEPVNTPTLPTPSPTPSQNVLVTESPVPAPDPREEAARSLRAVEVSKTALLAGSAVRQVETAGGNAAILTMKNDDGTLNYVSAVPLAVSAQVSAADPALNTAAASLIRDSGLYTVARVSCFRDHALPGYDADLAIRTKSGYRMVDDQDVRWTSPASQGVRDYLTALCVELAQMGFDEILLDHCGYPLDREANLGRIRRDEAYPVGELDSMLVPFLEQVKAALEPYDIRLSMVSAGSELAGETADSGIDMTNTLAYFDRFWMEGEEAAAYGNFASAGGAIDPARRLIPYGSAPGEEGAVWAVMD